jgi:hypothetical protein
MFVWKALVSGRNDEHAAEENSSKQEDVVGRHLASPLVGQLNFRPGRGRATLAEP